MIVSWVDIEITNFKALRIILSFSSSIGIFSEEAFDVCRCGDFIILLASNFVHVHNIPSFFLNVIRLLHPPSTSSIFFDLFKLVLRQSCKPSVYVKTCF